LLTKKTLELKEMGNFCGAENMTKGKPWDIKEERQLPQLVERAKQSTISV
jgi:hypothetical protein